MDKAQVAWKKIEERVQSCFLAACFEHGLTPLFCALPLDITEEELNFCMSDYASLQWANTFIWCDSVSMIDYIEFCRDRVRDADDFGIAL